MSVIDPRGSAHMLTDLYPPRMPSLENAITVPVVYDVLLPRCTGCQRPMHPAQNARRTTLGWMCMTCFEARGEVRRVVVRPLPRLRWWRRALAWFVAPTLPEARTR
jgi:hypothetical protein